MPPAVRLLTHLLVLALAAGLSGRALGPFLQLKIACVADNFCAASIKNED